MDIAVISVLCANAVASGVEPGFHLTGVVHATLIPRLPFGLIDARFGAYLAISALLIVTPGPDMALVTRNALRSGQRAASFTALGVAVGICTWAIASVIGIGVLLESSVIAFTVLKIAGAVYLGYLGLHNLIESFRSPRDTATPAFPPEGKHVDDRAAFKQGVAGNVLNPEVPRIRQRPFGCDLDQAPAAKVLD